MYPKIRQRATNHQHYHTILAGDFNFVTRPDDRLNMKKMESSGSSDSKESAIFDIQLLRPLELYEVHQPRDTHRHTLSMGKLDRIYTNHHPLDQMEHNFKRAALEWPDISHHRPIFFHKTTLHKSPIPCIPNHHLKHPRWNEEVQRAVGHLLHSYARQYPRKNIHPLRRLLIWKQAMKEGSAYFTQQEQNQPKPTHTWYDTSTLMGAINHMTHIIHVLLQRHDNTAPTFAPLPATHTLAAEWNLALTLSDPCIKLRRLKDIALQTTIQAITENRDDDQEENFEEAPTQSTTDHTFGANQGATNTTTHTTTTNTTTTSHHAQNTTSSLPHPNERKPHITSTTSNIGLHLGKSSKTRTSLRQLRPPGKTTTINIMTNDEGLAETEPSGRAKLLREHWGPAFTEIPHDTSKSQAWFRKAYPDGPPCKDPESRWRPTINNMYRAIQIANNSTPGPDGIPYEAWRATKGASS